MAETEVTLQIFETLDYVIKTLVGLGYKATREFEIDDYYFSKLSKDELKKASYKAMIENSFLVRNIITKDSSSAKLCYKDKEIDLNGNVISETKIQSKVEDVLDTVKIFEKSGLNNWCNLKNKTIVFKNDKYELAIQDVENLGLFVEFEEDDSMKELTSEEKIKTLLHVIKDLPIKTGDDYSCKKVYMKYKKED